ncbi:hypothetical protein R3W88_004533 [Solanum pinnatisectum]|uniref:Uncharacterized protein n=1 Tax=Solanum pinnatisectum TaxID=50273 RepID=A0AAV9K9J4_9SOLN|nr:hypothetical protein R3W88_004533 [Solanum pinnatisectum]
MNPTIRTRNQLSLAPMMETNPPNLNSSMNFIIWNCRGGNRSEFRMNFRSLMDCHIPPLELVDDFPFNRMIQVPSVGNFGGMLVLWDDSILELDDITTTRQEIHVMVKPCSSNNSWLLSCIYASTCLNSRKILWDNLRRIKDTYDGKWIIDGDFNKLLTKAEKIGGRPINKLRTSDFWNVTDYCELIDLGF